MKITVKTTFDFGKLARYIESGQLSTQANRILGSHIAHASKRFIMQGKVKPKLKPVTRRIRKAMGIHQNAPLFRTGTLANSLKPTKEGIVGADYGLLHLEGKDRPQRNFIVFEEEKIRKPLNTLMKKVHRALKK